MRLNLKEAIEHYIKHPQSAVYHALRCYDFHDYYGEWVLEQDEDKIFEWGSATSINNRMGHMRKSFKECNDEEKKMLFMLNLPNFISEVFNMQKL